MAKTFRPVVADQVPDVGAAQQFHLIGEAKPAQVDVAGSATAATTGQVSSDLAVQQFSLTGEAKAGVPGGYVLDAAIQSGPEQPAQAATFPADAPPTVEDGQILIALKDGSLFLFDADMLSGDPLPLRDALGAVGLVFDNSDQDSQVLEDYGLTNLLGGWLAELQALGSSGGADLSGHNGIF